MSTGWSFETRQIHAGQTPDPTTRPRPADLPDHVLRLRQHRARGEPVRAQGVREHLHPAQQPHHRRGGAAPGQPRGRRRRAAGGLRPVRRDPRPAQRRRGRRPHRLQPQPLRRHLQPVPLHLPQTGHPGQLRGEPGRPALVGAAVRPNTKRSSPRRSPTPSRTSWTSRAWPGWPTRRACRWWWTTPSPPPT